MKQIISEVQDNIEKSRWGEQYITFENKVYLGGLHMKNGT